MSPAGGRLLLPGKARLRATQPGPSPSRPQNFSSPVRKTSSRPRAARCPWGPYALLVVLGQWGQNCLPSEPGLLCLPWPPKVATPLHSSVGAGAPSQIPGPQRQGRRGDLASSGKGRWEGREDACLAGGAGVRVLSDGAGGLRGPPALPLGPLGDIKEKRRLTVIHWWWRGAQTSATR